MNGVDTSNSSTDVCAKLPQPIDVGSITVLADASNVLAQPTYKLYELDMTKINDIEDCKKILKVLFDKMYGTPLEEGLAYGSLSDIEHFCHVKEVN